MKRETTVEVPCANITGKSVRLTRDHESNEVAIALPVSLRVPKVHVDELARAAYELQDRQ